jgi:acetoin utilization protein AcuC
MTITIGYSPAYLNWTGSHASPQRARLAVEHILAVSEDHQAGVGIDVEIIEPSLENAILNGRTLVQDLKQVHESNYVDRMLSGENHAHPGNQGTVAAVMFEGTRVLVPRVHEDIKAKRAGLYFNPQGAKHHAAYDHSSGFCAFNDMAWAAKYFSTRGLRVAYLDWDAHHGDGVQDLTAHDPDIMTISMHQGGIFPGTGLHSEPGRNVYNYAFDEGDGDSALMACVKGALDLIDEFEPDVLLLAAGADGHKGDPLAGLEFTVEGFSQAAAAVGEYAHEAQIPVLVGGAGGYQPFTYVPLIWSEVIFAIHEQLNRPAEF